ncbi:MAG: AAA family ATPase [Planctomycetota bacterium]|jgi:ATP-dependent Lon protease|nr:AAA family ATPase [Planctomycetota bacterium]
MAPTPRPPKPLRPNRLRWTCPASWIPRKQKAATEIDITDRLFGQERAIEVIQMGLAVDSPGYNVFVCGVGGTDRAEVVQELLTRINLSCQQPHDHVFVHNFEDPMAPKHLLLVPGGGEALAEAMGRWVHALGTEIPRLLKSEEHLARRHRLFGRYQKAESQLFRRLEAKLRKHQLSLVTVEDDHGVRRDIHFLVKGEVIAPEQVLQLEAKQRPSAAAISRMMKAREKHLPLVDEARQKSRALGLRLLRESSSLDESIVQEAVEGITIALAQELEADLELAAWLGDCAHFALNNTSLFLGSSEEEEDRGSKLGLEVFEVNRVRTMREPECPIVFEPHPNYSNLFGTVERSRMSNGPGHVHLAVRPGSILLADGGFLVLDARDIFKEAEVWRALKRTLQNGALAVHALENLSPLGVTGARPQAIPMDLKVVLVGNSSLYEALHDDDFDFPHIFKVRAEFDDSLPLDKKVVGEMVCCFRNIAEHENLLPPSRDGLQALVERAVHDAGRRNRISVRMPTLSDFMREASYYASRAGKRHIDREAVDTAREKFRAQHALDAEWHQRHMLENIFRLDTSGELVGVVNGLTVVGLGPLSFGRPARISAMVAAGEESYTNIDREVDLAGSIHNKGMLMLENFMRWKFGAKKGLAARMSLVFDQNYGPIDGDSASTAELYALLSALAKMPLKQSLAVTGSLSMRGAVQAIGGVNQKIEGFFDLCLERGLTGDQGVIVPAINVDDLMLSERIVQAVKDGSFQVYGIDDISDGISLLTGKPAKKVFAAVEKRLHEMELEGKSAKDSAESQ